MAITAAIIGIAAFAILLVIAFALALMRGSADEQAAYEKSYQEYIDKQKKRGVDLR